MKGIFLITAGIMKDFQTACKAKNIFGFHEMSSCDI